MKTIETNLDELLHQFIENQATDIHFDTKTKRYILRRHKLEVGVVEYANIEKIYEYLKFKAHINLSHHNRPQSGAFTYIIYGVTYYFRFSVIETYNRKHGVLRVLNLRVLNSLEACGIEGTTLKEIRSLFTLKHGLVLFAGKTGAGKSTTLFTGLNERVGKQIFTLESPIERVFENMIQIETTEDTLNRNITQLLRHDPDIIVLGEIRTSLELQEVVRASLSGHLVMSTLHSGSILEVIHRLQDLNISHFDLSLILKGIVYQEIRENETFYFESATESKIHKYIGGDESCLGKSDIN